MDEYEIICVNDGSTDDSLEIINEYQAKYRCIKLLNQENQGRIAAKNAGIRVATGKYLWIINSDDYVSTSCAKFIVNTMDKEAIDVLTIHLKVVCPILS